MNYLRVQFNNSWFLFHNSSWSFHEPYFSRKHFHKSYGMNKTQDYGLKTYTSVPNYLKKCHNFKIIFMDNFHHHQFLYWAKVLQTSFFTKLRQFHSNKTIQTLIYYFIYSGGRKAFHKVMQHKEIQFAL